MKKGWIGLVSSVVLLMGLSGCGEHKDTSSPASSTTSEEKKVEKPTAAKPFIEGVPMQWVDVDSGDVDIVSELCGKNEISAKAQYFEHSKPTGEWSESEKGKFTIQKVSDKIYRYTFDSKEFYFGGNKTTHDFSELGGHPIGKGKYEASFDAMEIDNKIYIIDRNDKDLSKRNEKDYSEQDIKKFYDEGIFGYILEPTGR